MATENTRDTLSNASVAYSVDSRRLVINRGRRHGVQIGQRFLVYSLSEEDIKDPVTGKSLGQLEIFKGTGRVVHTQDFMATIESDRVPLPLNDMDRISGKNTVSKYTILPFEGIQIGDKAKLIELF